MVIPRKPFSYFPIWIGFIICLTVAAAWHLQVFGADTTDGFKYARELVGRFFPPEADATRLYAKDVFETLSMAVWGTALAAGASFIATFFGASNFAPNRFLYTLTRGAMTVFRGLPDYIWAMIFVVSFGPGPLAGLVTIGISRFGELAKLWCDELEQIDSGVIDGCDAAGAYGIQRLRFCGWPCIRREAFGNLLFCFDRALREAALIGVVGAGGVGMSLSFNLRLFRYQEAATIILMIVAMIFVAEAISTEIRKRLA